MILPDINERYQEIMAQCRIDYKAMKNGSIIKPQLSTHEEEELKNENRISQRELKNEYEEKIAKL